ncbi:MAG TPA: amidohydrolase [Rectinemataceae bacterium]|nr:amidohydrolase [Rectinemataceae bacterium]
MNLEKIVGLSKEIEKDLIALRHDIHAHPELGWKEVETSKKIESLLEGLGCENIKRGFGGTGSGVVADIAGSLPGPCVALRADIDALPIQEANDVPYASTVDGVMHACGHDAHAAILIGAARILSAMKDSIPGRVRLIFQPAEETGIRSGAPKLIEEGVLDGVSAIGGLHVMSEHPAGVLGIKKGPLMASADIWEVAIQGQGGHGAMPHKSIDPTIAASYIISMLQTVVSREINPLESVVISVGKVETGSAPNVIPDKALITGNVRTTDRNTRSEMESRMGRIIKGVSDALRCASVLTYTQIYGVTVNDPELTELMVDTATDLLGEKNIKEIPIAMGSEDFSYYGEKIPAVFAMLGINDPAKGTDKPHHSPHFNAGDDQLARGAALLAGFALNYLSKHGEA